MSLLTDEEIEAIENQERSQNDWLWSYTRAIEAAVLAKLNSAEPVAWRYENKNVKGNWYITWTEPPDGFNKRALYEHPPAPSAPDGLHIIDCGFKRCGTEATPTILIGFNENDWSSRDKFKAMLAAARSE